MIRGGDFSMLKVWVGLEARSFLQASIETVSQQHKDLVQVPNGYRLNDVSSTINCRRTYEGVLSVPNGSSIWRYQ